MLCFTHAGRHGQDGRVAMNSRERAFVRAGRGAFESCDHFREHSAVAAARRGRFYNVVDLVNRLVSLLCEPESHLGTVKE